MNKEKLVFVACLAIAALLIVFGGKVAKKKKRIVVRSAPLEVEKKAPKKVYFLRAEDVVWDLTSRNIFEEPRDIQDLPALELTYPTPLSFGIVKLLPLPAPAPGYWSRFQEKFSSETVQAPGSGDGGTDGSESSAEEVGVAPSFSAPSSGYESRPMASDSPENHRSDPAALYDRVVKDGRTLYGKIRNPSPRDLIDSELDGRVNQYLLRDDEEIDFQNVNLRTGRPIGVAVFKPGDIEYFSFADTVDNLYFARNRQLSPGDLLGRIELADWCFEREALDLATKLLLEAKAMAPERSSVRVSLAKVYRRGFRWEDELAVCEEALADKAESGEILTRLGEIYEAFGLVARAEQALRESIDRFSDFVPAYSRLGVLLLGSGRGGEGVDVLQSGTKVAAGDREENRFSIILELVRGLIHEGRSTEADRELARALDLRPGDPRAVELLGVVRYLAGDTGSALEMMRGFADASSGDEFRLGDRFSTLYNLGVISASANSIGVAETMVTNAMTVDPMRAGLASAALASVSMKQGRWEEAFDRLERALLADPRSVYGNYLLGKFHSARGNHEEAVDAFRRTLLVAPEFDLARAELGRSYYFLDDFDAGVRFLRAALQATPNAADLHVVAALQWLQLRNAGEAKQHLEKALRLDADLPSALNLKAVILYESGGAEEVLQSLDYFQRAIKAAGQRGDRPSLEYATLVRSAIAENRSKVQWADEFNRKQIKRGWRVSERYGIRVAARENRIEFRGTQSQDAKITSLARDFAHRKLVSFQVDLDIAATEKASFGVALVRRQRDDTIRDGIFFGKDPEGKMIYRIYAPRGTKDPVELPMRWPSDGKVTVGIELANLKEGRYNLLVDGEAVHEVKVTSLKQAATVELGVLGSAGIGSRWNASADDVVVVMRKE